VWGIISIKTSQIGKSRDLSRFRGMTHKPAVILQEQKIYFCYLYILTYSYIFLL